MNRNKCAWNDDLTMRFLNIYIEERALWDPSHPHYANRTKQQLSYSRFMEEFGITLNDVKKRIQSYRNTYRQAVTRMEENNGRQPTLYWFREFHEAFTRSNTNSPNIRFQTCTAPSESSTDDDNAILQENGSGKMSNALFLKSLQSTLDNLSDEKNMQARIIIQDILHKIAFDDDFDRTVQDESEIVINIKTT